MSGTAPDVEPRVTVGPAPAARPAGLSWPVPVVATGAALLVLAVALRFGHGLNATTVTGLPDPGRATNWGLPIATTALEVLATLTAGLTVTAAFLLPGRNATIGAQGYRLNRLASPLAALGALASATTLAFTVSDLLGIPLGGFGSAAIVSFAVSVSQGQALALQAILALVVAVLSRATVSRTGAATTACLAVVAVLPPAFTGHAAGAGNHQIAVTSLALHVAAAALWVGGLAALLLLRRSRDLPAAAARYSRLALGCFLLVAVSGLANAWVRLGTADQLWHSRYGVLVLGKTIALLVLGTVGAVHRRLTLPALRAGTRRAFLRLAAGEVVLFGATIGLAVALSRSPTPVPTNPVDPDAVTDLIGFGMPAPATAARMIGDVLPDMFFLTVTAAGTGAYLVGVWRMRRAGHHWPPSRTASWLAGMLVLAAATNLGVARYAYVLFSVHMAQHMVLSMLVPILLVGGAPITLALRTLRRPADPQIRGARDWLLIVLRSRVLKLLTHPLVALGLYLGSLYVLYFTGLFATLMRYHLGHLAMLVHFVASGYLLFWVLIGIDPGRRRLPPYVLIILHFISMTGHAFFGVILLQSTTVIAPDWYAAVHPPWAAQPLTDQHLGAAIAWSFGEIPAAAVFAILVLRWIRADEREQARIDRAADRAAATGEPDELARYNEFLARAARAAQAAPPETSSAPKTATKPPPKSSPSKPGPASNTPTTSPSTPSTPTMYSPAKRRSSFTTAERRIFIVSRRRQGAQVNWTTGSIPIISLPLDRMARS